MKILLQYGRKRSVFEIGENDTVGSLKTLLKDQYSLNLKSSGDSEDMILKIAYAGSQLKDEWIISDIGILPGSVLQCSLESRDKIYLRAYSGFNKRTYDFTTPITLDETTIEEFKSMIQDISGIPVTMMRLCKTPNGLEMYDGKTLSDYDVMLGDTMHIDIWDGMGDFLLSVFAGDVTTTMNSLVEFAEDPMLHQYQLRVALFIASFHGYLQLVSQLLKSGARCDSPVGVHPARSWYQNSFAHPLSLQTPTHAAAQNGKITCLRLFIHHNPACILPRDGFGRTPTGVARKYGQKECFKLLVAEQFRAQKYSGLSLSVYGKVRKWCDRARDRVAYYRLDSNFPVLLATSDKSGHSAVVGSPIQMNGFGDNIQSSASKLDKTKVDTKAQWLWPRREEFSNMVKISDDKKVPRTLYRALPSVRNFNTRNVVRRSSSLDSVRSTTSNSNKGETDKSDGVNGRVRLKTKPSGEFPVCTCRENASKANFSSSKEYKCQKCGFSSTVKLPNIQASKAKSLSNLGSFFITQDIRNGDNTIEEEVKPADPASAPLATKTAAPKDTSRHSIKDPNKLLTKQAHSFIEQTTGQNSRDLARSSLEVCETFTTMGWLRRLNLATNYNRKTLLRYMRDKGHRLSTEASFN